MEWMIAMAELDNDGGIVFPTRVPEWIDDPMWSLYSQEPHLGSVEPIDGPFFEDGWDMYLYGHELTFPEAVDLARQLGLNGSPIGGNVVL